MRTSLSFSVHPSSSSSPRATCREEKVALISSALPPHSALAGSGGAAGDEGGEAGAQAGTRRLSSGVVVALVDPFPLSQIASANLNAFKQASRGNIRLQHSGPALLATPFETETAEARRLPLFLRRFFLFLPSQLSLWLYTPPFLPRAFRWRA